MTDTDFMGLVKRRYSSRAYTAEKVSDEDVMAILDAGRLAPTGVNAQHVRVIAVRSEEGLAEVGRSARIFSAPLAFIVTSRPDRAWVREKFDGFNIHQIDASIVTTQMMYEATARGLGSVWICFFDPETLSESFGLEEGEVPINILAVGHRADETSRNHGVRIPMEEFAKFA